MSLTKKKAEKAKSIEPVIPDKLYFRIGEVAELCELPTYVLRFWETECSQLRPTKSSTGQRMYRRRDVDNVLHIRKLLNEDRLTIAVECTYLRQASRASTCAKRLAPPPPSRLLCPSPPGTRPKSNACARDCGKFWGCFQRAHTSRLPHFTPNVGAGVFLAAGTSLLLVTFFRRLPTMK